jgi:mono/diheme cytochrome c family protein
MTLRDLPMLARRAMRAAVVVLLAAAVMVSSPASAQDEATGPRDPPPPLPAALLKDPKVIAQGEKVWKELCTHCHGAKAYPGKAPKLEPRRYTPEFVWDRVHNGFRNMPPWKEALTPEQIIGVVAWVLSDEFWP